MKTNPTLQTAMAAPPLNPMRADELVPADFPEHGAPFKDIAALGYTFDGYAAHGMERCAEIANAALSAFYHQEALPDDVVTLRTCLFFETRRWLLYDQVPDQKARVYIHALIDSLKAKLEEEPK
ncbi:hypothetical protein BH24DEI2_BH24DEI2_21620 [soil metagenome]